MIDAADYCRRIETYLCQKNAGHLIRIVGPAFEQVRGWAEQGVPLKVAFRGIDRYCERQEQKPARRRPVRIEFCEADVLEAFDDWRRAVGVAAVSAPAPSPTGEGDDGGVRRKASLASHIERAVARLSEARSGPFADPALIEPLEARSSELRGMVEAARHARGEARRAIVERLAEIDRVLLEQAAAVLPPELSARLHREAVEEIAPFADRMPAATRIEATQAAYRRLVREALGLPVLVFE